MILPEYQLVSEVSKFLLESRPDVFSSWPEQKMRHWLRHHIVQQACAIVAIKGEVMAVGIGWRGHMGDIDDRWSYWDDTGDCFYFDQLHSKSPLALATIIALFEARVPDWQQLRLIADRKGRRVQLNKKLITRLQISALAKDK